MKKVLEMDDSDWCLLDNVNVPNATELYNENVGKKEMLLHVSPPQFNS